MNSHKNAKLTARGREEMVRRLEGKSAAAVAADYGLSIRTVRKWKHRYAVGGVAALVDASSRPKRCRSRLTREDGTDTWLAEGTQDRRRDRASSWTEPQHRIPGVA